MPAALLTTTLEPPSRVQALGSKDLGLSGSHQAP